MTLFNKQKNKGFTLVETLVAIAIFTTAVLTMIVILSQGITSTNYAKKKIVAGYLAQEGIEYVRNLRDTYVLYSSSSSVGWTGFINKLTNSFANCQISGGCYFDDSYLFSSSDPMPITKTTFYYCGTSCPELQYDSATGHYNNSNFGSNSGFVRQINIDNTIGSGEIKVSSTVYWRQGSGIYNIAFSENLFNWSE